MHTFDMEVAISIYISHELLLGVNLTAIRKANVIFVKFACRWNGNIIS